jgi:hypothetical protein
MTEQRVIPEELDSWDWKEAFGYAGEVGTCAPTHQDDPAPFAVEQGGPVSIEPVSRWMVKRIIALSEGEPDGAAWLGFFELLDGRFLFLEAGCDYTGWD